MMCGKGCEKELQVRMWPQSLQNMEPMKWHDRSTRNSNNFVVGPLARHASWVDLPCLCGVRRINIQDGVTVPAKAIESTQNSNNDEGHLMNSNTIKVR